MKETIPIVIVLTPYTVMRECAKELKAAGFIGGTDFFLTLRPDLAERLIVSDRRQVLVVGHIDGDRNAAISFTRRMKTKKEALTTVEFFPHPSGGVWDGVFDYTIARGTGPEKLCHNLLTLLRVFLGK